MKTIKKMPISTGVILLNEQGNAAGKYIAGLKLWLQAKPGAWWLEQA